MSTRLRCAWAAVALLCSSQAQAHILLTDPKPRDNDDTHKNDAMPCPPRTSAQPVAVYRRGARIVAKFDETVDHPGCFAVDIAQAGDSNWIPLGTVDHSSLPQQPRPYQTEVTLPAGMTCEACTLRVRQFMLAADPSTCPPDPAPAGNTYYQCANIVIRDSNPTDAGSPPPVAAPKGGCTMGGVEPPGGLFLFAAAAFLAGRRRKRR